MWTGLQNAKRWPPGSGLRIFIAVLVPVGYWVLASVFNSYSSTVRPSGVRLTLFPFPTGAGRFIPREEITACYGRQVVLIMEDGWEADHHYTMGVQTTSGHQGDIHSRYATAEEALAAAREVSALLNSTSGANPIPVELLPATVSYPTLMRQLLLWGGIMLIALALGIVWDRA